MNAKVLVVALALFAVQALCTHAASVRSADLDLADKAIVDLARGIDLGDPERDALNRLSVSTQNRDIGVGILQALQNILTAINNTIQNASTAVLNAINNAVQNADRVVQDTVTRWNQDLQNAINNANALNASVVACEAQQPSLQSVAQALQADVQVCAQNASTNAQSVLQQLQTLRPEAEALVNSSRQAVSDCLPSGLLAGLCLAGKVPGLLGQATGLAADATRLGAEVSGQLVVAIPLQTSSCVASATVTRGSAAADIVAAVRQCVQDSLAPTTAAVVTAAPAAPAAS